MRERGAILLLVLVLCVVVLLAMTRIKDAYYRDDAAEQQMLEYVATLYPSMTSLRVICANTDVDHNGYVRCAASGVDAIGNRTHRSIKAECPGRSKVFLFFPNHGNCVPLKYTEGSSSR